MHARAAVFVKAGADLEIHEYPVLPPAQGMAVVRLVSSGICGTDVHICEGAIPFEGPMILGHEFLGRVESLGAPVAMLDDDESSACSTNPAYAGCSSQMSCDCMGEPVRVGDLVAVNVIEPCGECLLCRTGGAASCLNLFASLTYTRSPEEPPHFHGGFAEVTVCPIRYLHRVPEGIPADVAAAFLCAGPTVVRAVAYAGGVEPGQSVVVQGSGPVGLFAALWAAQHGAEPVILIGSSSRPERLALAGQLGATSVLDIRTSTVEERHAAITKQCGAGADMVIECSGSPQAVPEGLALLRPRGRYVLAGQYSNRGDVPVPVHQITFNALQVLGSAQFTAEDRRDYFAFLRTVPEAWDTIRRTITHRVGIDRADDALKAVRSGEAIKALIVGEERI
jgi:threonine dehydrogenase-like Zn-dependent dehydrogenase